MPWFVVTAPLRKSTELFDTCLRLHRPVWYPVIVTWQRKRCPRTGKHLNKRSVASAFGRYMFIEAPDIQTAVDELDVESYVRFAGEPAKVPAAVMEAMQARTTRELGVGDILMKQSHQVGRPLFKLGTELNIIDGPLMGRTGVATQNIYRDVDKPANVQLELLGGLRTVKIHPKNLAATAS